MGSLVSSPFVRFFSAEMRVSLANMTHFPFRNRIRRNVPQNFWQAKEVVKTDPVSYWKVMPKLELFLIGCLMAIGLFVGLDRTSDVTVSDVKNSYQAAKIRVKEIVPKKSDE